LPSGSRGASPESAGGPASKPIMIAQTTPDPNGSQVDQGDDEEEDVPIPPNLLEDDSADTTDVPAPPVDAKSAAPDTSGAAAGRNGAGNFIPQVPETLRYVPPGETPPPSAIKPATQAPLVPVAPKKKVGLFGLTPAIVIASLAVLHFFVVKAVN